MNSNKRRLYFSVFILLALLAVAYMTAKNAGLFDATKGTNNDPRSNFTIKDTASIDKLIITKSTGGEVELTKNEKGVWMVNGKYKARPESISLIMRTFFHIRVKSRVGAAARDNAIKNLATFNRKVQVFANGEWIKTWFVGNPTADRLGTFMVLETPEDGRSDEPYITELAGFHGQLDVRFFTEEEDWKFTGIFNYANVADIKEIKIINHEKPEEGFTMQFPENAKPLLLDYNGAKVSNYDTLMARAYVYNYRKVHYENAAKLLKYNQIDSLRKAKPFYTIELKDKSKLSQKVIIYHMANVGKAEDLEGNVLPYNPQRAYALLETGDIVVIQYFVFDKLLRPLSSFIPAARKPS